MWMSQLHTCHQVGLAAAHIISEDDGDMEKQKQIEGLWHSPNGHQPIARRLKLTKCSLPRSVHLQDPQKELVLANGMKLFNNLNLEKNSPLVATFLFLRREFSTAFELGYLSWPNHLGEMETSTC